MLTFEMYRPIEVTIDENHELKQHQEAQFPEQLRGLGNSKKKGTNTRPNDLNYTEDSMMPLVQTFDDNSLLPKSQRKFNHSFQEDGSASPEFAVAGGGDRAAKKKRKVTFMDKFKKNPSSSKINTKFQNNTIRVKQTNLLEENNAAQDHLSVLKESQLVQNARSILQQPMPVVEQKNIKREISDHFDARASNPVHVNNVKSLFGIEGGSVLGDLKAYKMDKPNALEVIPSKGSSLKSEQSLDRQSVGS